MTEQPTRDQLRAVRSRKILDAMTVEERFWVKVEKTESCWIWTGAHKNSGYGSFWAGDRSVLAHRYSWALEHGPVPEGLELDHLCRVRDCVRPDHLDPVDHAENSRRGLLGWASPQRTRPTHCPQGHEYTPENTYTRKTRAGGTGRNCRECERLRRPAKTERERIKRQAARKEAQ